MDREDITLLTTCPLFVSVPASDISAMLGCLNPRMRNYGRDEIIAVAGDRFTGVGVMLFGEALITKEDVAGNRMIIDVVRPPEVFGEMASFSGMEVWPATVVAQTPCRVMFLSPDAIIGTCAKSCPGHRLLVGNMLRIVSKKALMLSRKLEYLAIKSMRARISAFLLEQSKLTGQTTFVMPLNRNQLADFLNVSRPSLSREMGRMRDEGIIDFHRSSVRITDPEALRMSLSE